jgi:glucose-1-phosphate thymidylyltransferase
MKSYFINIISKSQIDSFYGGGNFLKGLILAAGKGSRIQPFSYTQPKTMLPIANKPLLEYCIESLKQADVNEIGIVINPSQKEIINYVNLRRDNLVRITFIYQHQPKGIAHAVKQAEEFLENQPFILLLGDNLIKDPLLSLKKSIENKTNSGSIMLSKVDSPKEYGIAEIKNQEIVRLEEKPAIPASDLAVIGAYAFNSSIFEAIDKIPPSARGELEITDAIQWLIDNNHTISYTITINSYTDVGTAERWLIANQWMLQEITNSSLQLIDEKKVKDCLIIPPVVIGQDCTLKNSIIGPYVTIGNGTSIENCKIKNSIILDDAFMKNNACIFSDAIFGRESHIEGLTGDLVKGIFGDKTKIILT